MTKHHHWVARERTVAAAVALALTSSAWAATGPSSSASPYLVPTTPGVSVTSLLTVGDSVNLKPDGSPYKMVGIPDGLGAFDNGDGTFTVLMNHELGNSVGIVRAHNEPGAFVSKWVIDKNTLAVQSGADLITGVSVWNGAGYNAPITGDGVGGSSALAFGRFCSADLPKTSALFNALTNKGFNGRLFMNGEEVGAEGRAYATDVTTGIAYNLPHLGRFSWENSVASPFQQDKTIVMGMDDTTPGQLYMYVGTKNSTGPTPVEKAGLTGGNLFGIKVPSVPAESRTTGVGASPAAFTTANLGDVSGLTGATLQTNSTTNGVTEFLRPEDGAWDTKSNNRFYFVTTDRFNSVSQVGRSRLWAVDFTDIANPENGGTISMLLDGTEGGNMFDNITVDELTGDVILQEDIGNQEALGKVWSYSPGTDSLTQLLVHDTNRFSTGGSQFLTTDEESSGVIDVTSIFDAAGTGSLRYYLMDVQAHFGIPGELVEGGQLVLVTAPVPVPAAAWLMGSALAGLAGFKRRKAA